ncbi:MAG: hypothetical protein HS104_01215 [Polyangiaceae bacterium]|nr:hypothetical protein [Polyangiaceae bacterium]MCE7892118.1 hypothetical protein [Sorangiineae bacterium PRO1]MCL4752722.1 hypothetical protein [Myxococcales bacterium]
MLDKRLLWLAVPLAGLVELSLHYFFANRAPRVEEWAGLREPVAALRQAEELVVVAPRWADPLARQALGDALMPLRDVARPDESGYARAIEISSLGERAPELRGWRTVAESKRGRFTLRTLENPAPERVVFDFADHVKPEHLSVFEGQAPCAWNPRAPVSTGGLGGNPTFPAERFMCPGGEWFFAGVTVIDDHMEYRPRRCIWAHPPQGGPLRLRFANVPLGKQIRGYGGMPWLVFRDSVGAPPIELEVRVGGQSIGTYVHRDEAGFAPFSFDTGRQGQSAEVEIEVRSSSAKDRHFCFQADSR